LPLAFMLIKCETGAENEVLKELEKIDSVEEAYAVHGTYDTFIKIKADKEKSLKNISTWKIKKIRQDPLDTPCDSDGELLAVKPS